MHNRVRINTYAIDLYNLYAGGLILISLIILPNFITSGTADWSSFVAVIAFSVSIPFLSGILVLNAIERRYQYSPSRSMIARVSHIAFALGILITLAGIDATFWHIHWVAGLTFLGTLLVAFIIYGLYVMELDDREDNK